MDNQTDNRDLALLEQDRYTFFVLKRILGVETKILLTDHEKLILCYTGNPYPVWIWTPDDGAEDLYEKAYALAKEEHLLDGAHTFNLKYDLAEYFIRRAKAEGLTLNIQRNMFAYDCPAAIAPGKETDGEPVLCQDKDLEELTQFVEAFHTEIGIDIRDTDAYREDAASFIQNGRTFFWKNEAGKHVATCQYSPTGDMASVNLVYTRKDDRRCHYAEHLVYYVTTLIKEQGLTPMLYTDADYEASNACYEKIGYILRGKLCTIG